mgnify:CR=1 FL=1
MPWDERGHAEGSKNTQLTADSEKKSPGRPKGSKNKKSVIEAAIQTSLVNELEQDAMEIYRKAAEMAKDGDKTMMKLFLQRLLPELKAQGEGDENKGSGGIQIVVNQGSPAQNVEEAITVNQIQSSEDSETESWEEDADYSEDEEEEGNRDAKE